jgi:transposase
MQETKYSTYDIRMRAVTARLKGMSMNNIASAYQVNRSTLHRWTIRYRNEGEQGLVRCAVSGRPSVFKKIKDETFLSVVLKPAVNFGYETDFWTSKRLCHVFHEQFHISCSRWTVWRHLRDLNLTYQKPQRHYFEASVEQRVQWRKKELPKIKRALRRYNAILYCQDESTIRLTAILAKTWSPRGHTPIQRVTGNRGSIAAMSAISHKGQLLFKLHEKRIASDEIIQFLKQLSIYHKRRHLVVIMDQAPPHMSKKTQSFIESQKRLHVFHLPPYSPDWNPDEQVWNHLKNHELKSHQAKTKQEMLLLTEQKLTNMANNPQQLQGIFFRCCVAELLH